MNRDIWTYISLDYISQKFNKNEEQIFQNQTKLIIKNISYLLEKKSDLFLTKIAQENNIN